MKLTIPANELLAFVTGASKLIEARTTLPVLSCVLLTVGTKGFSVSATNLDQWLRCDVEVDGCEPGECCIGARFLSSLLATFGKSMVTLSMKALKKKDPVRLVVSCGSNETAFMFMPASEFPEPTAKFNTEALHVGAVDAFAQDLAWVARAMSKDASNFALQGLHIRPTDGAMAATDQKRAHIAEFAKGIGGHFILPTDAVSAFRFIIDDARYFIISAGDNTVRISAGKWTLISRTIEGAWPWEPLNNLMRWDDVKPRMTFNASHASRAIGSATAFGGEFGSVTLSSDLCGVKVCASTWDIGAAEWSIDGKGNAHPFSCKGKQLTELVGNLDEEIEIRMSDEKSPVQMRAGSRRGILMPMALQKPGQAPVDPPWPARLH